MQTLTWPDIELSNTDFSKKFNNTKQDKIKCLDIAQKITHHIILTEKHNLCVYVRWNQPCSKHIVYIPHKQKFLKSKPINLSLDGCLTGDCHFLLFHFTIFPDFLHQMYFIKKHKKQTISLFYPKMKIKEETLISSFPKRQ